MSKEKKTIELCEGYEVMVNEQILNDFDYIIELRNEPNEVITYETVDNQFFGESEFGSFEF